MVRSLRQRRQAEGEGDTAQARLRVISWNLLRLVGAGVADVAALIERERPDLLLMQEATAEILELPKLAGGHLMREPMERRVYGLAVWSPNPLPPAEILPLPVSKMPGRVPPRLAQIVRVGGIAFANVHLSHGQILNRRQLMHIVQSLDGPSAIIGDYNAVGPIVLSGFRDIGPQQRTHHASNIIPFRLDRCMARGLQCLRSRVLERGPSDHHPIALELDMVVESEATARRFIRFPKAPDVERVNQWVRALSQSPERIRVPRSLFENRPRRRRITRHEDDGAFG
jgi:endonuclease/exonuclease/phosphatase (EEP) superfamily protein YafD